MPIYSYRCETCGNQQDILQKMSDPLLTICPACGAATFRKQVTAAGFQLKGSGWYVTDFRNPASKESSKGTGKAEGDSGSGSTGDGEAKPATTAEPATAPKAAESSATASKTDAAPAKPSGPPASGTT